MKPETLLKSFDELKYLKVCLCKVLKPSRFQSIFYLFPSEEALLTFPRDSCGRRCEYKQKATREILFKFKVHKTG